MARQLRAVGASLIVMLVSAATKAQSVSQQLQTNFQISSPLVQKAYFAAGWVQIAVDADALGIRGRNLSGFGGAINFDLRWGITDDWAWNLNFGGGPAWGNHGIAGDQSTRFVNVAFATGLARTLYLGEELFVVAHAAVSYSMESFEDMPPDGAAASNSFSLSNNLIGTPVGVYANFGKVWQVIPGVVVTRYWKGDATFKYGTSPGETISTDGLMTVVGGIDLGYAPSGVYFGINVEHTPAFNGLPSYTAGLFRLMVSMKLFAPER